MLPLHLRPVSREWTFGWLAHEHPDLVGRHEALYAKGAYVPAWYARRLTERVRPLLRRHGLDRAGLRADPRPAHGPSTAGPAARDPLFG